jgi:hypothetical protein
MSGDVNLFVLIFNSDSTNTDELVLSLHSPPPCTRHALRAVLKVEFFLSDLFSYYKPSTNLLKFVEIEQLGCALVRLDTLPSDGREVQDWYSVHMTTNAAGWSVTSPQVLANGHTFVQANFQLIVLQSCFRSKFGKTWVSLLFHPLKVLNLSSFPDTS